MDDDDDTKERLSEFLEAFPVPLRLSYKQPHPDSVTPWVFWRETNEEGGYGNDSSSSSSSSSSAADHLLFHNNLLSLFSNLQHTYEEGLDFVQFWAPVTIGGRRLLSASALPFAISHLDRELALYRVYSAEYKYKIDENYNSTSTTHNEAGEHLILSGGPATAFLNRTPYIYNPQWIQSVDDDAENLLKYSIMLPVCFPSQTHSLIGVLELIPHSQNLVESAILYIIEQLKQVGMDVCCDTQQHIPYKTINGLKPAKDKIEEALKIVCETHKLTLAQVWIAYEDKNHVPLSSSLENPPKKALKLGGYLYAVTKEYGCVEFQSYYNFCDIIPEGIGSELALKTLKDYKPRYIFNLQDDIISWEESDSGALAICLRSNETGDFDYVLELIWIDHPKSKYVTLLENIFLTLKGCLPGFKFASGAELGDEINIIDAQKKSADCETSDIKIFLGKRSSPLPTELEKGAEFGDVFSATDAEKPKQSETNNFMAFQEKSSALIPKESETGAELGDEFNVIDAEKFTNSETSNFMILQETSSSLPKELKKGKKVNEAKFKTALIELPTEAIVEQFGKTMKEAAANLHVSLSTLKRKFKPLGIPEWPGPSKSGKRRENNLSSFQINANEGVDGAIHDASTVNIEKHMLTIKAEYASDIVKIHLPVSQATFASVEEKVGVKLKLMVGTYKLKYRDEDGDLISLLSDEDLKDCVKCSEKSDRIVVRLQVLPYA